MSEDVIDVLADCYGNVKRAHEELSRRAREENRKPVGLTTLHDAIRRDLTPGFMAGLRQGVPAARGYNPALKRPPVHRNQAWEGDHKRAPLKVLMPNGELAVVWVTWFEDRAHGVVMGWAVTPVSAHRGSVLAALRHAVLRDEHYGPAGGLPQVVRIDRGRDFLSKTVTAAFGALGVRVHVVNSPRHKGGVERLNRTAMTRFFADLPGYAKAPLLDHRTRVTDGDPAIAFTQFVTELRDWVKRHNTEEIVPETGTTRLQAWEADPVEIREVSHDDVRAFMLESDDKAYKITSHGVTWNRRTYMPEKAAGRIGSEVRIRWMPHHDHEIEIYEYRSNRFLGRCYLSDEATDEQLDEVFASRKELEANITRALKRAQIRRRERYGAVDAPQEPTKLKRRTRAEITAELDATAARPVRRAPAEPYKPRIQPADSWVLPGPRPTPKDDDA
ncbi:Mu transposase C-terminal domain-containing protein [Kitasatospora sp. NPDC048407]|uniref:Mu transposase C-terminal domain-containing protein n=1 Tax=Kitasatospora sp. NPDC048407 TaxID=3364051 RepID=UPI00371C4C58